GDIKPGAVALAHDRRPREQASGEGASLVGAGAYVVECVEAIVDTGDRDPRLSVVQVVGNDAVVRDRLISPDGAEGIASQLGHGLLLLVGAGSVRVDRRSSRRSDAPNPGRSMAKRRAWSASEA